jgi:LAO/AO transport system kinase
VLNLLEDGREPAREAAAALLDRVSPAGLGREAPGHLIGITGPPGAGKSTLLSALVAHWRAEVRSVAVLAVDPSSRRSGGALLGDRQRIAHDPADPDVFIRSTASAGRLGGLAPSTRDAAWALAAAFDVVVVETVGVGQSETDVADLADTTALIVQPGSGDTLQFLKAGIMEVPDVLVVTKADIGLTARRTVADLRSAVATLGTPAPVLAVRSVPPPQGIEELVKALDAHRAVRDPADVSARRAAARHVAAVDAFAREHGEAALRAIGGRPVALARLRAGDPCGRWSERRSARYLPRPGN